MIPLKLSKLRLGKRFIIGVPFVWLDGPRIVIVAVLAIVMASIIGALGSLYPAWRASRRDPYDLVRGEG